jgi:hypothetical protein
MQNAVMTSANGIDSLEMATFAFKITAGSGTEA